MFKTHTVLTTQQEAKVAVNPCKHHEEQIDILQKKLAAQHNVYMQLENHEKQALKRDFEVLQKENDKMDTQIR